jgi:hypothetical protein
MQLHRRVRWLDGVGVSEGTGSLEKYMNARERIKIVRFSQSAAFISRCRI